MAKDEREEAKPASEVLSTLGLVDVVIGGLFVYLFFLEAVQSHRKSPFVATGNTYVDLVLMLCIASLAGKLLLLVIAIPMAFGGWVAGKVAKLRTEVTRVASRARAPGGAGSLDLAMAIVQQQARSAVTNELNQVRTEALFAYGAAFLGVPYALVLKNGGHARSGELAVGAAILMFALGFIKQIQFAFALRNALWTLRFVPASVAEEKETEGDRCV